MTTLTEEAELRVDVRDDWNNLFGKGLPISEGSGITSRFEFVDVLDRVLVPAEAKRIFWTIEAEGRDHYFPCFIEKKSNRFVSWAELRHIPDLYPGRSGLAELIGNESNISAALENVFDQQERWDSFSLCVLAGGPMERCLLAAARRRNAIPYLESALNYPYVILPGNWDELYSGFSKKFRYNIRNSQKLIKELGELSLKRVTSENEVREFLDAVYSIERNSWKEEAGTSLTKNKIQEVFHEQLAPIAADSGLFRSYVLYLNCTPVAHVYGLLCHGVFYSLKLSYIEQYRKVAPGIVLTALVLQDLIADGVKCWDWSGPSEEYKRRWSKDVYCLRTYKFFGNSWKGQLLRFRTRVKEYLPSN